jgi:hypothetical protein
MVCLSSVLSLTVCISHLQSYAGCDHTVPNHIRDDKQLPIIYESGLSYSEITADISLTIIMVAALCSP